MSHHVTPAHLALRGALLSLACLALCLSGCLAHHKGALPGEPEGQGAYAELDDARVHYIDVGERDAPLVVLVHGFASSLNAWAGVTPALVKEGYRVVALDLKGFGWTDRPRGDYSPGAQAELVLALLEELGLGDRTFGLVAHSWGSSVALAMALSHGERIERITLYDAWVYEEQLPTFFLWSRASSLGELLTALFYTEQSELKMRGAFYDTKYISEPLLEEVDNQLSRPGTRYAALEAIRGQRFDLVQERYGTITQPTLLLWGREDAVTPLWVGERLFTQLPNAELVVFPLCGHFPMIEAYASSTTKLIKFLKPLKDASGEDVPAVREVKDPPPVLEEEEDRPAITTPAMREDEGERPTIDEDGGVE